MPYRVSVAAAQRPTSKDVLTFLSTIQRVYASAAIDPVVPPMVAMQGELDGYKDVETRIAEETAAIQQKLREMEKDPGNISIAEMFEMQMLMNRLSQLSEMSTSVVSAMNATVASMARNVKNAAEPAPAVPLIPELQGGLDTIKLLEALMAAQTEAIQEQLDSLKEEPDEMEPGRWLELQFMINLLSQLGTTATNILAAMNDAINAVARNIKGASFRIVAIDRDALSVTLEGSDRLAEIGPALEQALASSVSVERL